MSFYPFENVIGFGVADFIALALAAALIFVASQRTLRELLSKFAERTVWCMILLAAIPVLLRLILLPHHPAPSPDVYDEFGHLFVADTLRHFRLANPPHPFHRFFETFFILQQPTYSSIYPLGQGLMLAFGRAIFGHPWAGVLFSTAAFCSLTYWMLRAWVAAPWALTGGVIAIVTFGPLCSWMNSYWGGSFAAAAGCLVFGALPRLKKKISSNNTLILGTGLSLIVLIRPYESVYIYAAVAVYLFSVNPATEPRPKGAVQQGILLQRLTPALIPLTIAFALTLFQNKAVTGNWTTLPYSLSQSQYGVPAALTFQPDPVPHRELTPQQALEYKAQLAFKGAPQETLQSFLLRLEYRVRFYRFFFLPPLFVALLFFLARLRDSRFLWVAGVVFISAIGINFFPAFQFHYLAPVASLFILMSISGLERLNSIKSGGPQAATALVVVSVLPFVFWYTMHLFDKRGFSQDARRYETWNGINHTNPERRIAVNRQLAAVSGKLLVFVRYSPSHMFQDEWVYNEADIDRARIIWARDLGDQDNQSLRNHYPDRKVFLLEPDERPPQLEPY